MKTKSNVLLAILLSFFWLFFTAVPSHAATMDVTSYSSMTGDCDASVTIFHDFTISGTTVDLAGPPDKDVIALVLYDGEGTAFAYIGISVTVGYLGSASNWGWLYPILNQPQSRPFTMKIFDNTTVVSTSFGDLAGAQHGTILDVVHYDPADYGVCGFLPLHVPEIFEEESAPVFADGRINNWDTGNPIVVYGHDFENGRGLVVYSPDGLLLLAIRPEALIDCPTANRLIASANGVSLYYLASCEYQLHAPSLDGTKSYVLIFTAFYENTGYRSYEE